MSEQERSLVRPMKDDPIQWPENDVAYRGSVWLAYALWVLSVVLYLIFPAFWTGALLLVLCAILVEISTRPSRHSKGRRR